MQVVEQLCRAPRGFGFPASLRDDGTEVGQLGKLQLLLFLSPFNFPNSGKFPERGKSPPRPSPALISIPPP